MTEKEKAKAYDEALERAKKELQKCGPWDYDTPRQIFKFFPELREIENEKIRKWLLNFVQGIPDEGMVKPEFNDC